MQNKIYLYLVDNTLQLYSKKENEIYEHVVSKKIIEDGKIIHRPKFLRELKIALKKNHLIKKFQKNILYFIVPPNFKEVDKEILKMLFEDLMFHEIKIIKEINYYHLRKNTAWINLNREYMFITYLVKTKREVELLKNNTLSFNFLEQLKIFITNHPRIKKIYLFGTNEIIPEISKKLEREENKIILYFEDPKHQVIKEIIRHNSI